MTTKSKKEEIELPKPQFLSEDEWQAMMERTAQEEFGMSVAEFFEAWKTGEFDNDRERHGEVISLAMMIPEAWELGKT